MPRGWQILGAVLASWALLILIMWCVSLIVRGGECRNRDVTTADLPPKQYRHEPYMPFRYSSAELIKAFVGEQWRGDKPVSGYYKLTVWICAGLTGKSLRIARMHEEAHAMGWKH